MLHGWLDNLASFDILAPQVSDCNLLAVDLAGHGNSSHLSEYNMHTQARLVVQVARQMNWTEPYYLIGHSLGGAISTLIAAAFPKLIKALVLIESLGPISRDVSQSVQALRKNIEQRLKIDQDKTPTRGMPVYKTIEAAIEARQKGNSNGAISDQGARLLTEYGLKQLHGGHFTWKTDRVLTTTSGLSYSEDQVKVLMSAIQCPVLCILGNQGFGELLKQEEPKSNAEQIPIGHIDWNERWELMAKAPSSQRLLFDGGHHLHMDNAASTIASEISKFIARSNESKL